MKINKKFMTIILCFITILFCLSAKKMPKDTSSSLTENDIKNIENTTWRIDIKSNVKNTTFGVIEFSVFEKDPIALLKKSMDIRKFVDNGKPQTEYDNFISSQVDWNMIFTEVKGNEVFITKAKSDKNVGIMISANSPEQKRWLVSKVVYKKDGSFSVWIIPFEAKIGETTKIEITDKNEFDINSI